MHLVDRAFLLKTHIDFILIRSYRLCFQPDSSERGSRLETSPLVFHWFLPVVSRSYFLSEMAYGFIRFLRPRTVDFPLITHSGSLANRFPLQPRPDPVLWVSPAS